MEEDIDISQSFSKGMQLGLAMFIDVVKNEKLTNDEKSKVLMNIANSFMALGTQMIQDGKKTLSDYYKHKE